MINFDGTCYEEFSDVPNQLIDYFSKLPIHTHYFLAFDTKLIQLEANYFSIMAALRRSRVIIPMKYSLEYFQDQAELIICLLYTSPSPRDLSTSRMPSSA